MAIIMRLFGEGQNLDSLQMGMRALVIFVAGLLLIRISGRRSFGQRAPFDYIVAILLGATLSRAIVGASPFLPTLMAALVIVLLHRGLAWLCVRWPALERLVVGTERELFRDGKFNAKQMSAALIAPSDIFETARQTLGAQDLERVQVAFLERNGEISLIRR